MDAVAYVVAAAMLGVAAFHVVVAGGAPLGRFTQGGRHETALPRAGRIVAVVSAGLVLLMAAVVLARVDRGPATVRDADWIDWAWWATVAYLTVGVVANAASRSRSERLLWTPIVAALLVLTLMSGL